MSRRHWLPESETRAQRVLGVRAGIQRLDDRAAVESDGTVEAVVQGDPRAVGKILAWAKLGPPMARVTDVSARAAQGEFDRPYSGFEELPSA